MLGDSADFAVGTEHHLQPAAQRKLLFIFIITSRTMSFIFNAGGPDLPVQFQRHNEDIYAFF